MLGLSMMLAYFKDDKSGTKKATKISILFYPLEGMSLGQLTITPFAIVVVDQGSCGMALVIPSRPLGLGARSTAFRVQMFCV
ncbi:hypothetical protein TNCV_232831 [Trichonephila clavipes]|nr:hypothetical protein TNCV_232831 [Trichonephila clavipes]